MNIYNADNHEFKEFISNFKDNKIFVFGDIFTLPKASYLIKDLTKNNIEVDSYLINEEEPVPTLDLANFLIEKSKKYTYILAVGSGSINDLGKYVSTQIGANYGIFATAPSMDGYLSKGSALILKGIKETLPVKSPDDMLIDLEVLKNAPDIMISAGVGDILGKYTSLADWQFSNILNQEEINQEAFDLMNDALNQVIKSFDLIIKRDSLGISHLINALNTAGKAMMICGNSRPASGSEHHISHYLEMDYIKKGLPIPLHGLKVGLGTLVSLELYHNLDSQWFKESIRKDINNLVNRLPSPLEIRSMLERIKAPICFTQIGVEEELLMETIKNSYKVRDRFTILTYYNQTKKIDSVINKIVSKYL